jgi:hypothetical protein
VRKFRAGFSEKSAKSLLTQICAEKNMRIKRKKRTTEVNESLIDKNNYENSSSESKSLRK